MFHDILGWTHLTQLIEMLKQWIGGSLRWHNRCPMLLWVSEGSRDVELALCAGEGRRRCTYMISRPSLVNNGMQCLTMQYAKSCHLVAESALRSS